MPKPNFILIMTDQHCWDQLACHGNTVVKTPNIDRLYERGTSIDGVHTATPMCMPNRQAFLTMRMGSASGQHSNGVGLDLDSNTFANLLRTAGYRTGLVGKVHLQNTTDFPSFQKCEPVPDGKQAPPDGHQNARLSADRFTQTEYLQEQMTRWADDDFRPTMPYYAFDDVIFASKHSEVSGYDHKRQLDAIDPTIAQQTGRDNARKLSENRQTYASNLTPEQYSTHFIAEQSAAWLDAHVAEQPDDPFFLWTSFTDPHHPWTPPETYYDMYDPDDVVLPDSFYESPRTQTSLLRYVHDQPERIVRMPFMTEEAEAKRIIATAYGMITFIDDMIGELLDKLDALGLSDNTVIIFTSDHGDYMGHHGLFLKGVAHYQALIKVPFIWCDPIQQHNRGAIEALASYVDIGRTILDRADLWHYHGAQGQSFLPLLTGETDAHRSRLLVETVSFSPQFGVPIWARIRTIVTEQYRLTIYTHQDEGELYDLTADPFEIINLWESADHQTIRGNLLFQLAQEMADLQDVSRIPMYLA